MEEKHAKLSEAERSNADFDSCLARVAQVAVAFAHRPAAMTGQR